MNDAENQIFDDNYKKHNILLYFVAKHGKI